MDNATWAYLLVGHPNAGKTTLFNHLTQSHHKVVNYPGATVSHGMGHMPQGPLIIDTPGIQSFDSQGPDQSLTFTIMRTPLSITHSQPIRLVWVVDARHATHELALIALLHQCAPGGILVFTHAQQAAASPIDTQRLSDTLPLPVFWVDTTIPAQYAPLITALTAGVGTPYMHIDLPPPSNQAIQSAFDWSSSLQATPANPTPAKGIDHWLLHPLLGSLIITGVLLMVFVLTFVITSPMVDGLDALMSWVIASTHAFIPHPLLQQAIGEGLLGSLGAVVVFLPPLFVLSVCIALMEESGFLSRMAVMYDRTLTRFGMEGRSMVPILSGYGCAIPAIMSCRHIPDQRERWATMAAIPMGTCMARLPVYALLLAMITPSAMIRGLLLTMIYVGSLGLVLVTGRWASHYLTRATPSAPPLPFHMTLPNWKRPSLRQALAQAYQQVHAFVLKAGLAIVVISLLLWGLSTFPSPDHSLMVQVAQHLNPVMGLIGTDWRVGVGLIASFGARELFGPAVRAVSPEGIQLSLASTVAIVVFYMMALQCGATLAILKKEFKSLRVAAGLTLLYTIVAMIASVITYQLLNALRSCC